MLFIILQQILLRQQRYGFTQTRLMASINTIREIYKAYSDTDKLLCLSRKDEVYACEENSK